MSIKCHIKTHQIYEWLQAIPFPAWGGRWRGSRSARSGSFPWCGNRLPSPWWHWKLGTQCNEPNTQGPMPGFLTQIIAWNISHIFAYIALTLSIICKCYLTQARQHLQAVTGIASIPDSLAAALSLLPSHGSLEASVGYCLQCSQQTKCIAMI